MTTGPTIAGCTAMILVLTACDAGPPRAPAVATPTCADARISFGRVYRHDVLTAVAPAVTVTSRSGGPVDAALRPVRRYRAEVVAGGDAPPKGIYRAFVGTFGDERPMPGLGEVAPVEPATWTAKAPGRFVRYEGVQAVAATFGYACGAVVDDGTVTSWLVSISGALSCDRAPRPSEPIHQEALALACPE